MGIIQLKERKRVRLLVRRDAFYRYFSCLVYVPREIFTTDLAYAMQDVLMQAFKGIGCYIHYLFFGFCIGKIHFLVRVNPKVSIEYNVQKLKEN